MSPPALQARGIERRFGRFAALRGVDLELPAGETLALFGPNGAGKTTFLRIAARLLRPTAGSIAVGGHDLRRDGEAALRSLGFLSHEPALYADLTPSENLYFTARLHGISGARERVREALAAVGLQGRDVPVRALSRGLQQRAALARALLHRPRVVLLDEPWTGLDPDAQAVLGSLLAEHRAGGGSAVLTTHDLRAGHAAADRVALLAGGRIVLSAPRHEVPLDRLEREWARAHEAARP